MMLVCALTEYIPHTPHTHAHKILEVRRPGFWDQEIIFPTFHSIKNTKQMQKENHWITIKSG